MNEILNNSLTIKGLYKREIERKWYQDGDMYIYYLPLLADWLDQEELLQNTENKNLWKGYTSCVKTGKAASKPRKKSF